MGLNDRPSDAKLAWNSFLTNALVMPGLGTLMLGYRRGIVQMALAIGGVVWTGYGVISMISPFLQEGMAGDLGSLNWHPLAMGIAVFLAGWIWAMIDGWHLWRVAQKASRSQSQPPILGNQ